MNAIRRIGDNGYFAIELDGQEDWIMRPAMGRAGTWWAGISPKGLAWFYSAGAGFVFYDAARRELAARLRTPPATDHDGKETHGIHNYALIQSENGQFAYLILHHGIRSIDMHIIDVEDRSILRSLTGLPGGGGIRRGSAVLDGEGHILISATLRDEGSATPGLVRVNPQTGTIEKSTCAGSPVRDWLHSASPLGRYWLRADDSRLPVVTDAEPAAQLPASAARRPQEYFSFAVEIWSAFPLRRLHSVAPMWMTAEELPDNGFQDNETRKQKLPALRGQIYRNVSRLLDQDVNLTMRGIRESTHPDLWPAKEKFHQNITSNLHDFAFSDNDMIGWQPDGQAFWIKRNGFVACVGIDGTVSPKIMLERFGYRRGTWLPCAAHWHEATPLPDRHLDLRYENEVVTVSGAATPPTPRIRVISKAEDQHRPYAAPRERDTDEKLAKKAESIAKRNSVYVVDLASMDESDCVAAINALAALIGPDINDRPYDNQLQAVFKLEGKKINEKKFFSHVAKNCPGAAPSLKRLIESVCEHLNPYTTAYYEPYGDDVSIGLFGFAAWCLACLDRSSNDTLIKYGKLIDTYHEHFYLGEVLPLMLKNTGDVSARLDLCEHFFFGELGNNYDCFTFWRSAGMAENAARIMSPKDYAARLVALARQRASNKRSQSEFGFYCFDSLARNWAQGASPWESELLQHLRGMLSEERLTRPA